MAKGSSVGPWRPCARLFWDEGANAFGFLPTARRQRSSDAVLVPQRAAILILVAAADLLVGCGVRVPHTVSLAERCADVMKAAMPSAEIDIKNQTSQNAGIDKIMARVEGTRTDLSPGLPRDLAAECEFEDTILSAFHWTKGGPPQRP
jgi:hypothetical protein